MAFGARVLLAAAALLGSAGALRLEAGAKEEPPHRPYTAVCVVGNAGTLPFSEMHISLWRFVNRLNATGLVKNNPDFYSFLTLQGVGPRHEGHSYLGVNVSRDQALYAIMTVGPVAYKLQEEAFEVTEQNIDKYINNRETCFNNGVWADSPRALRKSLNQLTQWQHCMKMILHQERIVGKKYEVVVLARPDLAYKSSTTMDLAAVADENHVIRQRDWVMAMPRRVAAGLVNKERAKPLTCNVGEPCCGTVGSSATLLEYLTGISTGFDSCQCGPKVEETGGPIEQSTNLFIGRIILPETLFTSEAKMVDVPFETVMTEHDGTEII